MKKILIVDDDPDVVKLLQLKLEKAHFEVISTTSGREAVRLAENDQPDLLVCDIDMPEMNGGDVAIAMTNGEATKHIPIVFLSSLVTADELPRELVLPAGRWPILSKASPIVDLIQRIDGLLGNRT